MKKKFFKLYQLFFYKNIIIINNNIKFFKKLVI